MVISNLLQLFYKEVKGTLLYQGIPRQILHAGKISRGEVKVSII